MEGRTVLNSFKFLALCGKVLGVFPLQFVRSIEEGRIRFRWCSLALFYSLLLLPFAFLLPSVVVGVVNQFFDLNSLVLNGSVHLPPTGLEFAEDISDMMVQDGVAESIASQILLAQTVFIILTAYCVALLKAKQFPKLLRRFRDLETRIHLAEEDRLRLRRYGYGLPGVYVLIITLCVLDILDESQSVVFWCGSNCSRFLRFVFGLRSAVIFSAPVTPDLMFVYLCKVCIPISFSWEMGKRQKSICDLRAIRNLTYNLSGLRTGKKGWGSFLKHISFLQTVKSELEKKISPPIQPS